MKPQILLVAAEASSLAYAVQLLQEFKKRNIDVQFFGIGGEAMEELGFETLERSEKMAVVGLFEVLAHFNVIRNAFLKILGEVKSRKPRFALLLDYPGFNLRLAQKLWKMKVPVVYYISPQVWAWRQGRVHLIKKIISKMLVVFPFEVSFYQRFEMPATFVGHPLLDELKTKQLSLEQIKEARGRLGVVADDFLVALLPGSRPSELKYCLETQLKAAEKLYRERPKTKFFLLVAPTFSVEAVASLLPQDLKIPLRLIKEDPSRALQWADCALVASGTATLLTGLLRVPMVIMYKMNTLTGFFAKRLVKGPKYFGMANLVLGEQAVPELFQEQASAENLCSELKRYIDDPSYLKATREKLSKIEQKLGSSGAQSRVVDECLEYLK
jgi:lipid-A-disaccharide synthase